MRVSSTKSAIRYSQAFKLQVVREAETGASIPGLHRKYSIKGNGTVLRWVRQFGSGKYGKLIRVERPEEVNELTRLRSEVRRAKEALADAHMALALEKAYLQVACDQMDLTVDAFKKKHDGKRRTKPFRPHRS